MLSILSGFTSLWSLPVIKYIALAVVAGGGYLYINHLNNTIDNQQLQIANKDHQIINLTQSVDDANKATQAALKEIENRERLAAERLLTINKLNRQVNQFDNDFNRLEQTNETVKDWASQSVPSSIVELLIKARNQNSHSNKSKKNITAPAAYSRLSDPAGRTKNKSGLGKTHQQIISVNQSVQF